MIFVTGGTGLLGSHLLVELSKKEDSIRCSYRNKERIDLVQHIFKYYLKDDWKSHFNKIEWIEGDILDISFLEENILEGCDVYHCAAYVTFDEKKLSDLIKINRTGTENVVNVCLAKNIRKLCYVSSTAALGDGEAVITEQTKWKKTPATSAYSVSKYSAEKEVWRGIEEGLNAVIVNPCVILGPGDWNESSLAIFKNVQRGLSYYPPGSNATVDARDVATIMVKLMDSDISGEQFLCIGSNQTFKHLITEIAEKIGVKKPTKMLTRTMANTVKLLMGIAYIFSSKSPTITGDTVANFYANREYSNTKVRDRLNFEFYTLPETIENAVDGRYLSK